MADDTPDARGPAAPAAAGLRAQVEALPRYAVALEWDRVAETEYAEAREDAEGAYLRRDDVLRVLDAAAQQARAAT